MRILGQDHVKHYLSEGLRRGRLTPSLLFVGTDGVGKQTVALQVAQCFGCEFPEKAASDDLPRCGTCAHCLRVQEKNHSDLMLFNRELQAVLLKEKTESQTAIKIESIRVLEKFLSLTPMESRRRTVIVDEAHKMTTDAANALLKVLEEPPHNAQIILLAADEHSLPSTVQSRCGVIRFKPVSAAPLAQWLKEKHGLSDERAMEIAERSGGSFAKAERLKDEEEAENADLGQYDLDEFFDMLAKTQWKKEGRKKAENAVTRLIDEARKKLAQGDLNQSDRLEKLFAARKQIDRHVPPKLVLENLYLTLESSKERTP